MYDHRVDRHGVADDDDDDDGIAGGGGRRDADFDDGRARERRRRFGVDIIKLFPSSLTKRQNKLERLPLASISSLTK